MTVRASPSLTEIATIMPPSTTVQKPLLNVMGLSKLGCYLCGYFVGVFRTHIVIPYFTGPRSDMQGGMQTRTLVAGRDRQLVGSYRTTIRMSDEENPWEAEPLVWGEMLPVTLTI